MFKMPNVGKFSVPSSQYLNLIKILFRKPQFMPKSALKLKQYFVKENQFSKPQIWRQSVLHPPPPICSPSLKF